MHDIRAQDSEETVELPEGSEVRERRDLPDHVRHVMKAGRPSGHGFVFGRRAAGPDRIGEMRLEDSWVEPAAKRGDLVPGASGAPALHDLDDAHAFGHQSAMRYRNRQRR